VVFKTYDEALFFCPKPGLRTDVGLSDDNWSFRTQNDKLEKYGEK
jgi:hypothetical protein